MIEIIGLFLLVMGIALDDFTTWAMMVKGMGILESNPIYLYFGLPAYIFTMLIVYSFIALAWFWILDKSRKAYASKLKISKFYDVFVFLFCFVLVFISFTKIEYGFNNLQTLHLYQDPEQKKIIDDYVQEQELTFAHNITNYRQSQIEYYQDQIVYDISYMKMIMIVILAYILFRVGFKVCPYEFA